MVCPALSGDHPTQGRASRECSDRAPLPVRGVFMGAVLCGRVRKLSCHPNVYSLFLCFPYIRDAGYGEEFKDARDGITSLSRGVFKWLVSIWPSHLVYRSGDVCYLEQYVPSSFARQFRYDQLYISNPNISLAFMWSLIDGARAWRYFIAGCIEARMCMLLRTSNLLMTLGFC